MLTNGRKRIYVGYRIDDMKPEILRSRTEPTVMVYGNRYSHTVGPFRTLRAARSLVEGRFPSATTVSHREKLAAVKA